MPEDREESGHDEPSANPKEEARGKHSLIRALLRTVHEIQFSLQNSLTVAGIVVIPLVAASLVAVGWDFPVPPAVGVGLLVPLWFIVRKTSRYAESTAALYSFGGLCSVLVVLAGFSLAYALKPKAQSPSVIAPSQPRSITGPAVTSGPNSPANTGSGNTFTYGAPSPPKRPEKTKKQKEQP